MYVIIFAIAYFITNLFNAFQLNDIIWYGVAILIVTLVSSKKAVFKIVAVTLSAVVLSTAIFALHESFDKSDDLDKTIQNFTAVITGVEERFDDYSVVEADVKVDDYSFKSRLYFNFSTNEETGEIIYPDDQLIFTADEIFGIGYVYKPSIKSTFNAEMYYKSKGIDLMISVSEFEVVKNDGFTVNKFFSKLNLDIKNRLEKTLSSDASAFVKGLLLGDKSDFSTELNSQVSRAGISHILAVSGMHIGMLSLLCIKLFGKKNGGVISIFFIIAFVCVIGPSASVLRASIMQFLLVFAWLLGREYSSRIAVWTAFVILLAIEPYVFFDAGFILSFATTIGIINLFSPISKAISCENKTLNKYIFNPISVSICATLSSIFFVLYYFGYTSTVVFLTNILILPFVAILFPFALIFVIISLCNVNVAMLFAWIIEVLVKICLFIIEKCSGLKYATVFSSREYLISIICIFAISIILFSTIKYRKTVVYFGLIGFTVVNVIFSVNYYTEPNIYVLSAGTGACVVVSSDFEITVMDIGSSSYVSASQSLSEFMAIRGYDEIDHLIISSIDSTHIKNLNELDVAVKNIVYPEKPVNAKGNAILEEFLTDYSGNVNSELPDYIELFDQVNQKLGVKVFDTLYLHAFTTKQLNSLLDEVSVNAETVVLADKVVSDYRELESILETIGCSQVVLSNSYNDLKSVSGVFARTTSGFGNVLIKNGGKYE